MCSVNRYLLLIVLISMATAASAEVASALLTTNPEDLLLWRSPDLGGDVLSVAWSPDGSMIAVGSQSGELFVFSSSGEILWRARLDGYVEKAEWSPDGSMVVAGISNFTSSSLYTRIYVFDYSGTLLWQSRDLDGYITDLKWSPSGDVIAVSTSSGLVYALSANSGNLLWQKTVDGAVTSIDWNPEGSRLAVGSQWWDSSTGAHGFVYVYSSGGTLIWQSDDLSMLVYEVDWSPNSSSIAVTLITFNDNGTPFSKVYVFSDEGDLLWESALIEEFYVNDVDWKPDASELAIVLASSQRDLSYVFIVALSQSGSDWALGISTIIYKAAWNPEGDSIALGTNLGRILLIIQNGWHGEVIWTSGDLGGPVFTLSWNSDASTLATAASSRMYVFSMHFGVMRIQGEPGTVIHAKGPGGSTVFTLPTTGSIEVYADPGVYLLSYELPKPENYIGDPSALVGSLDAQVPKRAFNNVSLPSIDDVLGLLRVQAPMDTGASVNIAWSSGSIDLELQPFEAPLFYAAPGEYVVSYQLPIPDNYIGDPDALKGKMSVTVDSGEYQSVYIPGYSSLTGRLVILVGDAPAEIKISWPGGSKTLLVDPNTELEFIVQPGTYRISYEIIVNADFIGDPDAVRGSISVSAKAGFTYEVEVPGYSDILGVLRLESGSEVETSVSILWEGGSRIVRLSPGEVVEFFASPGRYIIEYSLPAPANYIGDTGIFNERVEFDIKNGSVISYKIPGYRDILGYLIIEAASDVDASLLIAWNNGSKNIEIKAGEVLEFWASPGEYTITYNLPVPSNFVGNTEILTGEKIARVDAGSSIKVWLPGYRELLGLLEVKASDDVYAYVSITWIGGSEDFTLDPGEIVELWAAPGEYNLVYTLPEPANFVGDTAVLSGSTSLVISEGSKTSVAIPGYSDLLGVLIVRAPEDARVNVDISWGSDSLQITLERSEEILFQAAPGVYLVSYALTVPENYVGDQSILEGYVELEVAIGQPVILDIPGYDAVVGTIIIEAAVSGTHVLISWSDGSREFTVSNDRRLELAAAPGFYIIAYKLPELENYIGGDEGLTGTLKVEVEAGSSAQAVLPGYQDLLGTVYISAPRDAASIITIFWEGGSKSITLEAGSVLELLAAPGNYKIAYELPEPENYVGPATALSGEKAISVEAGDKTSVSLPGYENLLGKIKLTAGVSGTLVEIKGAWGSREVTLRSGDGIVLNAAPGEYKILYRLPEPENYVGSGIGLKGEITVSVAAGQIVYVEAPDYHETLAVAVIKAPEGSTVTLESETVRVSFELKSSGNISLFLDPGKYTLIVTYMDATVTKEVDAGKGGKITLEFRRKDFSEKLSAGGPGDNGTANSGKQDTSTASGLPGNTGEALDAENDGTEGGDQVVYAPPKPTQQDSIDGSTLMVALLAASASVASILLVLARKRATPLTLRLPISRESYSTGSRSSEKEDAPPMRPPSLAEIERLLGVKITDLKSGIALCEGDYKIVRMDSSIAPEGYEGEWRCCKLGCGGWGCAYRCQRPYDGEPVVFKVPRGLEVLVEKGVSPTLDPSIVEKVSSEAEAVARLSHEHLARLLAYSKSAPLLVYEYADGGSLEDQVAKGWKPSIRDALLIALQLGDALRYIHSRGMLHGDVKPSNILVKDRVVKLGDFSSLVRLIAFTSNAKPAFTPGWRAPEHASSDLWDKARKRGLENRIDVYQLGNLLLYLITGSTLDGAEVSDKEKVAEKLSLVSDEKLRGLLREMLSYEPWNRPNIEKALEELINLYKSYERT